jgi:hypothetical protein
MAKRARCEEIIWDILTDINTDKLSPIRSIICMTCKRNTLTEPRWYIMITNAEFVKNMLYYKDRHFYILGNMAK